ncbi:MAG: DUF302 domain-containing protein [Desulfuromonadales bacterium]|nr:DUF302 domain-containing protein [Desulfuromonadales bacterium]
MSYYFSTRIEGGFEQAVERVTGELQKEGFGILTEIDVRATLKKKLDVDFRNYMILGACNPPYAYRAFQAEPKIGIMLPCNVVVEELEDGLIEVAAVDPLVAMASIDNQDLGAVAAEIRQKLQSVLDRL